MKADYIDKYRQIGLKIAYYRKLRGYTQERDGERPSLNTDQRFLLLPFTSIRTASTMMAPLTIFCQCEDTPMMSRPLAMTVISRQPTTTPQGLPTPPDMETPPTTQAVMASIS